MSMIKFAVQSEIGKGDDMMRLVHPLLNKIFLKDDKMTCHSDKLYTPVIKSPL